nr:hypothetical protein [uncultured Chryseobacterium sp.]
MKKNMNKKNKILLFLIFSCLTFIKGQDLKLFTPIIITNLSSDIINNEKVNKVVLDYYNPNPNEMESNLLKYCSDEGVLYLFDVEQKKFKTFLNFKKVDRVISSENFLGIFKYFNLIKETDKFFLASSSTGSYPSHYERINSIEILEKSQKFLILKINYSDIYDFKGYGVLVLQDYKYTK